MTDELDRWYTVGVEVWAELDPDTADELLSVLESLTHIHGPVVSSGGQRPTTSVRFSMEIGGAWEGYAFETGRQVVLEAFEKLGVRHDGVARIEVVSDRLDELEFETMEPERLVGVAEVAALLGVAKQRVTQLRTRQGFPAPIAELAAGPVWKESSLRRFAETWERRPGRPRRVQDRRVPHTARSPSGR